MNRVLIPLILASLLVLAAGCGEKVGETPDIDLGMQESAENLVGLEFTDTERDLGRDDLLEQRDSFENLRKRPLDNAVRPAVRFDPLILWGGTVPESWKTAYLRDFPPTFEDPGPEARPSDLNDLAFAGIARLAALIRAREVSCLELTELYLARLEEHGPDLECVITLMPDRARARARELDRMLDRGRYLGPLHGIPYGAKDLLAVSGAPTTWGATPYRDQVRDETATVVRRLDEAGAVLVAKLTLGALAWGDVWFGGTTKNPWNLEEGSSGSSAGSASAVSAGLVPFAIGTETWGSIVSPATRCGVSGLRPTFGRVSRSGAMALSWTMDKIGPIARSTGDCAVVFDAIRGADGLDPTVIDLPFPYLHGRSLAGIRIGYVESAFGGEGEEESETRDLDLAVLDALRDQGADLVPIELPLEDWNIDPYDLSFILSVEAAAAFQELTLSGRDDELVRQTRYAWPNVFRTAHMIPAVEYVQANRHRTDLMAMMAEVFEEVDVYVTPSFAGASLLITNLTGHPQVVVPHGFLAGNSPRSVGFVGRLYDEATVLAVAGAYQQATDWHEKTPPGF
jgi:Asp-tRNA(Asn)/Glu-tRNA(Gln) amidotransferase A subunit family amidase